MPSRNRVTVAGQLRYPPVGCPLQAAPLPLARRPGPPRVRPIRFRLLVYPERRGREGLEQPPTSPMKTGISRSGGAESGAVDVTFRLDQPDLQLVIEAWPTLAADVRSEIVALIESSAKSK